MTLNELKRQVDKYILLGFGGKNIVIDGQPDEREIDSIQRNTMPEVEPDYLIIMKA